MMLLCQEPLEHSREEEELGISTLVTLCMKSKPDLNGALAQVAQLPAAAATPMQQGRVRVELVKPTGNYEAGTILSVPAHKMVRARDARPKTHTYIGTLGRG
jgi:hypothetical protein